MRFGGELRYQKIHSQIWHDEKFISLSDDGRLLFLYLLTSPHNNSVGLYVLPKQYAMADLGWSDKRFDKQFKELLAIALIRYDEKVNLLYIINHIKHNPLENENQTKAAVKIIASLPKSSLYSHISELLTKPFHKALREQLVEQYSEPETETKEKTGIETGTEKKVYGEFKNVRLTKEEHQKLSDKGVLSWIETLSESKKRTGKYKYDSDYLGILKWSKGDETKTTQSPCQVCKSVKYLSLMAGVCDSCRKKA